jgi:hypothetical protein
MGHPWKRPRAKPGMTEREYWGGFYSLLENGTIAGLVKIGKERKRVSGMKQNCLELQEKNRLLKRKISEFYEQGEGYGKSRNKR